jgi:hypothetical protein
MGGSFIRFYNRNEEMATLQPVICTAKQLEQEHSSVYFKVNIILGNSQHNFMAISL